MRRPAALMYGQDGAAAHASFRKGSPNASTVVQMVSSAPKGPAYLTDPETGKPMSLAGIGSFYPYGSPFLVLYLVNSNKR